MAQRKFEIRLEHDSEAGSVYSASFIYETDDYDAEFHRLNAIIDAVARALPGFCGVETWQAADATRRAAIYYWHDLETLGAFACHPAHLEAKRQYAKWYRGYHIVISQVIRSYGDGAIDHVTQGVGTPPRAG